MICRIFLELLSPNLKSHCSASDYKQLVEPGEFWHPLAFASL